jgi:predicted proteasome-type protease
MLDNGMIFASDSRTRAGVKLQAMAGEVRTG